MNKIFASILFALLCFTGAAQTISEPYKLWPKSNFRPPQDTTIAPERLGELRYKQSNGKFYKSVSLTGLKWEEFGVGGSGSPGGSTTQVQYNNAGSFAGSADLTWDNSTTRLYAKRMYVASSGGGFDNEYPLLVANATTGAYIGFGVAGGSAIGGQETQIMANGSARMTFASDAGIKFNNVRVGNGATTMQWIGPGGGGTLGLSHIFSANNFSGGAFSAGSGEQVMVSVGDLISGNEYWSPASGNATYTMHRALPYVNTTGSYAGTVRGYLFFPQIISATGASFTAYESTIGDWRIGSTGKLYVDTLLQDDALTHVVVRDPVTNEFKFRASSSLGGGSGSKFGVSGEDATATQARNFQLDGNNFQIENLNSTGQTFRFRNRSTTGNGDITVGTTKVELKSVDRPDEYQDARVNTSIVSGSPVVDMWAQNTLAGNNHRITVTDDSVMFKAEGAQGFFWSVQTLPAATTDKVMYYNPATHKITQGLPSIPAASHVFNTNLGIVSADPTNRYLALTPKGALSQLINEVVTKSAAYTIGANDESTILADATSGAFTISLPPAATAGFGRTYTIVKIDASANAVTLDGDGSEPINSSTTYALGTQWKHVKVTAMSGGWVVTGNN
jgi:hypothetical protein